MTRQSPKLENLPKVVQFLADKGAKIEIWILFAFGKARRVTFCNDFHVTRCVHFVPAKARWCLASVLMATSAYALDPAKTVTQYHLDAALSSATSYQRHEKEAFLWLLPERKPTNEHSKSEDLAAGIGLGTGFSDSADVRIRTQRKLNSKFRQAS